MQLKIIQIALGWRGEKYSLKVSDRMRSKLCDAMRHAHEWEEAFRHVRGLVFYGFRGLGSCSTSCRGPPDWRGIPFFSCFSGHWHAACSMSPHDVNSAGLADTHKLASVGESEPNACTCVMFAGSFLSRHLSTCTVKPAKSNLHTPGFMPGGCVKSYRHGNVSPVEERMDNSRENNVDVMPIILALSIIITRIKYKN